MKKLKFCICFLVCFSIVFCGCKTPNPLFPLVSELRSDVFSGSSENLSLTACYGFNETPKLNDAKIGERVYLLQFKLKDKSTDQTSYGIKLDFNGQTYKSDFKLHLVSHTLSAVIEIDDFNLKSFEVTVTYGSQSEVITLNSKVPENTLNYTSALDCLYKEQRALIDTYQNDNGDLELEVCARIIVKKEHAYWYVGLSGKNGNLKALLIDGITGETLAIREIF
ncbi:MAG: hypothetical protein IKB67_00180 [Clostridia bacterium]|nr:hypothetical protein [Clostridia bacterium]